MLSYEFRVGSPSGIYFSSWFACSKSTTLLQLHVDLQLLGDLVAGWNTLSGVTPRQWPNWENSMGRNWGSLSMIVLEPWSRRGSTVCPCHVLPSVECNDARTRYESVFLLCTVNYLCTVIASPTVQLFQALWNWFYVNFISIVYSLYTAMYSSWQIYCTEILYSTVQMFFSAQINLLAQQQQSRDHLINSRNL